MQLFITMANSFYADAILLLYKELSDYMKYDELIVKLVPEFIVTIQEKQDLDALQVGPTTKCSRLLGLMLSKGRNLEAFVGVLLSCPHHVTLAERIEEERQKVENGERLPHVKGMRAVCTVGYGTSGLSK